MDDFMFKIYFNTYGKTEEIRRFGLNKNAAFNYEHLRVKIREVCPLIQDDNFSITWKDSENDNVTISSDNELKIALNELHTDTLMNNPIKLHVTIKSRVIPKTSHQAFAESASGSNFQKLQHTDVICDVCNKEIYGFRYKCLQCPDYDLCKDCESKCHHHEHFMIRIPIPLQWKSHYGRKVSHLLNKFMKKQASTCPVAEEVTAEFGRSMRNDKNQNNQYSPWWLDTCSAYLSDWTNLTNGILLPEQKNKVTEECAKEPNETMFEKKDQGASQSSSSTSKNNPDDKRLEFLKTISENISQFLDPLGIDINVQMKTDKPSQPANLVPEKDENRGNRSYCPFNVAKNDNDNDININKPKENDESSKKDDSASMASTSNASSVASQVNDSTKNEEWTLLDSENIPTSGACLENPTSTLNNAVPNLNGNVPDLRAQNTASDTANLYPQLNNNAAANNATPLYPPLPTDINTFWHKDMKIQNAVVTMMKMGFTNENGWLTNLLVSTGGDINKAMDYITGTQ